MLMVLVVTADWDIEVTRYTICEESTGLITP